jgi:N-acetylglucosaminyldiphosphoundecaprenol N-acetyl-beta-D-mannosaminyltransferase
MVELGFNPEALLTLRPSSRLAECEAAKLLPRARVLDVLLGRAPLVGSRLDPTQPRGWASPVEARVHLGLRYTELAAEEMEWLSARRRGGLGMAFRGWFAERLGDTSRGREEARPYVVSASVDNVTMGRALEFILAPPSQFRARRVCFVEPHALNLATRQRELRETLEHADLVLPDGIGMRLAARILGIRLRYDVNAAGLMPALCAEAAACGARLVFVGGKPGVAAEAAARWRKQYPGLEIAHVEDGYLNERRSAALRGRLAALAPAVVLVGMGSPQQELWSTRWLGNVPGLTLVTVGALFDVVAGRVPRAPLAWRALGLKWLFRFMQEPSRLADRSCLGNPLFLLRAIRQRLQSGSSSRVLPAPR